MRSQPKIEVWESFKMVFIATRLTAVTQCWMARSWAGLWGSLMNNYWIIITTVLFLEASGTVPGSPDKFTELSRILWHFISHHAFPTNQDSDAVSRSGK